MEIVVVFIGRRSVKGSFSPLYREMPTICALEYGLILICYERIFTPDCWLGTSTAEEGLRREIGLDEVLYLVVVGGKPSDKPDGTAPQRSPSIVSGFQQIAKGALSRGSEGQDEGSFSLAEVVSYHGPYQT